SLDMLRSIANGNENLDDLANYARGVMKQKKEQLKLALQGYIQDHQRFMIKTIIDHFYYLTDTIDLLDKEIAQRMSDYQENIDRLDSIPGIARRMAEQMLAELGKILKSNSLVQR